MSDVRVETADGVCRVSFTRPETYNAMTAAMAAGFVEALEDAAVDAAVRVVVVTGEGVAFSAGAELAGEDPVATMGDHTMQGANRVVRSVVRCPKPVVARVNGIAAGVGASVVLAADLAVAAESAGLLLAFSRIGLMPDGGSSLTVAASVGRARAMRMALLGETLPAPEAHAAGLLSHCVPDAELDATTDAVVRRLARGPALALARTKHAVNAATLPGLDDALEREREGQVALFATADAREGMRAFVEGRRPEFTGR